MNLKVIFLSLVFFTFLIDSGGPFGLRPYVLVLVVFCAVTSITLNFFNCNTLQNRQGTTHLVLFFLLFYLFITYGFFVAVVNKIEFLKSLIWLVPIFFVILFVLFFLLFEKEQLVLAYIVSGYFFSIVILAIFFLALFLPKNLSEVVLKLFQDIPGWFYIRHSGLIPGYPNVYFQATLSLVSISLVAYFYNYKKSYVFFIIVLAICLSRFGVFVSFAFVILASLFDRLTYDSVNISRKFFLFFSLFTGPLVFTLFLLIFISLYGSYINDGSGVAIRLGHLVSVFEILEPADFLLGNGPGSSYYSLGFDKVVDNIEVSQLELFRKYGLLGFTILHLSFFYFIIHLLTKKQSNLVFIFLAFYLVSFSNPVLLTFNLSILISLLCVISLKGNTKYVR